MARGTSKGTSLWPKARLRALCRPWTSENQRSGRCAGACGPTDREAPWPLRPPWDQRRARSLALGHDLDLSGEGDPESNLASSAVSGQSPPAGPQYPKGRLRAGRVVFGHSSCTRSRTTNRFVPPSMGSPYMRPARSLPLGDSRGRARRRGSRGLAALRPAPSGRAGASRAAPRWPRPHHTEEGLRRARSLALGHGTVAVDMDPLSLLCRLASAKPPLGGRACRPHASIRSTTRGWPKARLRATRRGESMALAHQRAASPRGTPPPPPAAASDDEREAWPWAKSPRRGYVRADIGHGRNF